MADGFNPTPVKGKQTQNTAILAATDWVAALTGVALTGGSNQAWTTGNLVPPTMDLTGELRVTLNKVAATTPLAVQLSQGNAVVTAANPVLTQLSNGTSTLGLVATPLFVELSDGAAALGTVGNPLFTSQGAPGTAVVTAALTKASLAAGASTTVGTDLTSAAITNAKTGKLAQVVCSSSVRCKWQVGWANGSTLTPFFVGFSDAAQTFIWNGPVNDAGVFTKAGNGTVTWCVQATNEDNQNAADVYATIAWYEK